MASNLLQLQEILANILRFADGTTLCAAAQVNSFWAEEATNCIWRGRYSHGNESLSDPLRSLARLSSERRLWYTSKIRHLSISYSDDLREDPAIEKLLAEATFSFPNLRSAWVHLGLYSLEEKDMAQFLSPNLVSLELFGGHYTTWYLEMIKARSPRLRVFHIDSALGEEAPELPITASTFIEFLESMPFITHLTLWRDCKSLMNKSCLRYLMLRPNLEMLSLGRDTILEWDLTEQVLYECGGSTVFPSLRYLHVWAEERALQSLIPLLKNLQGVHLQSTNSPTGIDDVAVSSVLSLLSLCQRLEDIYFDTDRETTILSKSFRDIASGCPLLRRLEIGEDCESCAGFNDELIAAIAPQWNSLVVLCLPFVSELSPRSLACLSRHCPRLQELRIIYDFEFIDEPDPSSGLVHFSHLEILHIGSPPPGNICQRNPITAANAMVQLIDRRYPALKRFVCEDLHLHPTCHIFYRVIDQHLATTRPPFHLYWEYPGSILTKLGSEIVGH